MPSQEFQIIGVDELNRKLRSVVSEREILKVATNAFRKTGRHIRSEIVKEARTKGILHSLYRRRSAGLSRQIKLGRVRKRIGDFEMPLTAGGLLSIQERGGRLRAHVIRAQNAPKLVFVTHGRLVATPVVHHPGATHPKMPTFWPKVRDSAARLRKETGDAIRAYLWSRLRG